MATAEKPWGNGAFENVPGQNHKTLVFPGSDLVRMVTDPGQWGSEFLHGGCLVQYSTSSQKKVLCGVTSSRRFARACVHNVHYPRHEDRSDENPHGFGQHKRSECVMKQRRSQESRTWHAFLYKAVRMRIHFHIYRHMTLLFSMPKHAVKEPPQ